MRVEEVWKDIPWGFGRYQASNLGRIRSIDFFDGRRKVTGRILKPATMKSGHQQVMLGRGSNALVHVCVAAAFLGPKPLLCEVLHLNHDPSDNRVANLKYGTRGENLRMDYERGARKVAPEWVYSKNGTRKKSFDAYL